MVDEQSFEGVELNQAIFKSKININDMIKPDVLTDLKKIYGNVNAVSILFDCSKEDDNPSKILSMGHNNKEDVSNKKIEIRIDSINKNNHTKELFDTINLLQSDEDDEH